MNTRIFNQTMFLQPLRPVIQFTSSESERQAAAKIKGKAIPDARIMGKRMLITSDNSSYAGQVVQSIVWDSETKQFKCRLDQYADNLQWDDGISHEQEIAHSTLLSDDFIAGTVVDQKKGRLYLPDGRWMDGPTGDVFTVHGTPVGHGADSREQKDL